MRLQRIDGWPSAMRSAIQRHQSIPFLWGVSDCAVMCGDVMSAILGRNVLKGHRWGSEWGAVRALKSAGFETAENFFSAGLDEIDPALAIRGDIGIIACPGDALMSPAIIDGPYAFSKNQNGPVVIPRSMIVRAYAL